MSALAAKSLGVGQNLARIFQAYNNVIYSHLRETKRKTRLFKHAIGAQDTTKCSGKSRQAAFRL